MNFTVRFIADRVDLRTQILTRSIWILVEERLNLVMVLLKQGPDLFPLVRGEFQIFSQVIEFLINQPRTVDRRACLIRLLRLRSVFLSYNNTGHCQREHGS